MVTPDYCRVMARYNRWQNAQLLQALEGLTLEELTTDHRAFFGSILGTLNHLLWADTLWMSRFDDSVAPTEVTLADSPTMCATLGVWGADRHAMDGTIANWAANVHAVALTGELEFFSAAARKVVKKNTAQCVVHFFNHQTHHRGQVHAMMTKIGRTAPVSDLFFMPEEA